MTAQEKAQPAAYLNEQIKESELPQETNNDDSQAQKEIKRQQNMICLKTHWEAYRGIYVALDSGRLVGQGATIREANEQAKQQGVKNPLLVRVPAEGEAL